MTVITVSRQRGSRGSYIALEVAERLGLRYLDREILDSVARETGLTTDVVEHIEERATRVPRVMHLLGARPKLPVIASASLREQQDREERIADLVRQEGMSRGAAVSRLDAVGGLEYAPSMDYLDLVTSVILESAAQGDAMIVGRGGQIILARMPGVLHVKILSRFESRVFELTQREGIKWREAAHRIRASDEQRDGYLRRFYNVDWLDPNLYDLVINTDRISDAAAVEMIITAAGAVAEAATHEPA